MWEVAKEEFYEEFGEVAKEEFYEEFGEVTIEEFYEALFELVREGLVQPTGEYRDGKPVYRATPEAELSDEAKAYANKITRHRPN
jgi:hypothetical protein